MIPPGITTTPLPRMVFPARAGMIPWAFKELAREKSIPRESGDDPLWTTSSRESQTYSPRERG